MKFRPIAKLQLADFPKPVIVGNKSTFVRALWYLTSVVFFESSLSLFPNSMKSAILRAFGAQVGTGCVFKPRLQIKYPWFLTVGNNVWLGERAWIDNHTNVIIGDNCCISQGAYLFTGNHDWSDPKFTFFCKPIEIGEGAWVTAFQRVGPGAKIPAHVAVMADNETQK